ncbi:hypothetical protein EYF80_006696 [Liparis tanakae]|uniref:Uncharacterized protein n=1 Tax=Liparis tanakae TaxID=230148 RepID=A0A4Z2IYN0_9TELE|nr:hypothetical protein EYF80_006696 [Liparis tanakae]
MMTLIGCKMAPLTYRAGVGSGAPRQERQMSRRRRREDPPACHPQDCRSTSPHNFKIHSMCCGRDYGDTGTLAFGQRHSDGPPRRRDGRLSQSAPAPGSLSSDRPPPETRVAVATKHRGHAAAIAEFKHLAGAAESCAETSGPDDANTLRAEKAEIKQEARRGSGQGGAGGWWVGGARRNDGWLWVSNPPPVKEGERDRQNH